MKEALQERIEAAWEDRKLLEQSVYRTAVEAVLEMLDKGSLRVAEPDGSGWKSERMGEKAVLLYFPVRPMETFQAGPAIS